jgi:hypothetical protein
LEAATGWGDAWFAVLPESPALPPPQAHKTAAATPLPIQLSHGKSRMSLSFRIDGRCWMRATVTADSVIFVESGIPAFDRGTIHRVPFTTCSA